MPIPATQLYRLTAELPSAIATLAVSGPEAVQRVLQRLELRTQTLEIDKVYYGLWHASTAEHSAAEQVVVCRTGPQTVELHCHGGQAICQALIGDFARLGCPLAEARGWTSQACPLALAAERQLLNASTDKVAGILLDQMQGALANSIRRTSRLLQQEKLPEAEQALEEMLTWNELGLHLNQPWRIVLAGPPNTGKSSLTNAIAGAQRVIVHDTPGTTRDWVEVQVALDGWPVSITDTAGIRDSADDIEQQGISRAAQRVRESDCVVFVVDSQVGWTAAHASFLALAPPRRLVAWNKSDLQSTERECSDLRRDPASLATLADWSADARTPEERAIPVIPTSCLGEPGIGGLLEAISQCLIPVSPRVGEAVPMHPAIIGSLEAARLQVRAQNPSAALKCCESALRAEACE